MVNLGQVTVEQC